MRLLFCALCVPLFFLSGCHLLSPQPGIAEQPLSTRYALQAEPLPGRVFDGQHWISEATALARLQEAERIILGERHDNADHHALQQQLVAQLAASGWLKQLSLEMLHAGFQADLDRLQPAQVEQVEALLQWAERNPRWPWDFYGPIIQTALQAGVRIQSANLERGAMMALYQDPGAVVLPDSLMREPIERQLVDSHCGQLAGARLQGMLAIQSARDRVMAQALETQGSLLLAGAFHARKDVGVPRYLKRPGLVSVGFIEWEEGQALASLLAEEAPRYDLLWVTPAQARVDPCAG